MFAPEEVYDLLKHQEHAFKRIEMINPTADLYETVWTPPNEQSTECILRKTLFLHILIHTEDSLTD
ncbi:hypothetical protein TVAG_241540 [Trichomonas vaginalis G3]|uniref:Uncharacterized protein n=1 Tax=Trichomonas vaginalis (strain ATCC PRA-98 / G3) TaxID=412133 RepID=A2FL02_TRIV3|nr:axonemal central apparatus assembly [Trichomonas vaginalis G3]EAX94418.1 hypothetical protein TVAG_241540 [Trichomonas vaginalis G3]KAI5499656.1 axonemal central apparatus assembly [Trichomonas vaginalis G3]|eukprot:XP_001307348.1 hypothetical protein [Trichomonas vaginalis G3]